MKAPNIKEAFKSINAAVHICEYIAAGYGPRNVVTWYSFPKIEKMKDRHYTLFTDEFKYGTLYLNYAELGKPLADIAMNGDDCSHLDKLQPFQHISPDFVVHYCDRTPGQVDKVRTKLREYYLAHKDYLGEWKPCYTNGCIPLATLITDVGVDVIEKHQYVKSMRFE